MTENSQNWVENDVGQGQIARHKQFSPFPTYSVFKKVLLETH